MDLDRALPRQIQVASADQQLVEQHAERVDVGSRVDVECRHLGLFRAHVFRRADHAAQLGVQGLLAETSGGRLGHAEVDHLDRR